MTSLKRTLGKSGIRVSALGLGTARIGGLGWQWDDLVVHYRQDQVDAAIRAIHRALDLGIDFFDTADVYGGGHSERILGQALAGRRHRVVIATKFGDAFDEQTGQRTGEEPSPAYIRRACQASLRRLNTDYIDLYLFHIRDYDLERAGEVSHTLENLVGEGKIRYYGWSTDDLERARFFARCSHCTAIEHRLNIMMDAPDMLALCDEFDLASINRIPLAMGLLGGRWTASTQLPEDDRRREFFQVPKFLQDLETVRAMGQVLMLEGRSYVQAALGWIWARNPRTVPVPGFRTVEQVEEDAEAMRLGPISEEQMQEIRRLKLDRPRAGSSHEQDLRS
ncbi:MAG: aldo/keto reductase [Anaerolineae bacterium]|jgi:aryl-alcohol dehydrogenase-like predicted oxidoreductase